MNVRDLRLVLTFSLASTVAACDGKKTCVADCDLAANDGSSSGLPGDSSSSEGSEGDDLSLQCRANTDAATMFIEQNNACQTMLDCTQGDALCYHGRLARPCGAVGLSVDADFDTWAELMDELEQSCECGAAGCESDVICNDQGKCTAILSSEEFCPSIQRDIETFLVANRSCETAADCIALDSICHVDDCSAVALNATADLEGWKRLDEALAACEENAGVGRYCNYVGECAFTPVCDEQGQCAVHR